MTDKDSMTRALLLCPPNLMKSHLMANVQGVNFVERAEDGDSAQVIVLLADFVDFMPGEPDFQRYKNKPWIIVGERCSKGIEREIRRRGINARFLSNDVEIQDMEIAVKQAVRSKNPTYN